jgi:hypothetical protein
VLAEEYGYQLSPQPAAKITPMVETMAERKIAAARLGPKSNKKVAEGGCFFFVMMFAVIIAAQVHQLWVLLGGLVLALAAADGLGKSAAKSAQARLDNVIEATDPVRRGPWQAWPARLEAIPGKTERRLLLLGPDSSIACEFRCVVPNAVWTGMTDGRGLLWFVGDLRFGGLACLPGGEPLWWTGSPTPTGSASPPSGVGKTVEDELARQAVKFVFDRWLS